jgi:hypothetical protein
MENIILLRDALTGGTASAKTEEDVSKCCLDLGFKAIRMRRGIFNQFLMTLRLCFKRGNIVLIYPAFITPTRKRYLKIRIGFLKMLGIRKKLIFYVVDLPIEQNIAARGELLGNERPLEKQILSLADCMIVFGEEMQSVLIENYGFQNRKFIHFELLDYMTKKQNGPNRNLPRSGIRIVVAGNLSRDVIEASILDLPKNDKMRVEYHFYGSNGDWIRGIRNDLVYHGLLSGNELVDEIKQYDFGLVLRNLNEGFSEYLRLGSTSKFSLYIAAGLPIVAPEEFSYVARVTKKYGVGLVFQELNEIPAIIDDNRENYSKMKEYVTQLQGKVSDGFFFKRALEKCIQT